MKQISEPQFNYFKTLVNSFLVNYDNESEGIDDHTSDELKRELAVAKQGLRDWYKDITGKPINPIPEESGKIFYKLERFLLDLIRNIDGDGLEWHVGDMDIDILLSDNSYELALRKIGLIYNDNLLSPVASMKKSKKNKSKKKKSKKKKSKKKRSKKKKSKKKKSKKRKSKNK